MNKTGAIVIIEDDAEDEEILSGIFKKLAFKNEIIFFNNGTLALEYLNKSYSAPPFLILSDMNMPKMDGFALRKQLHANKELSVKCIPFLFFTTGVNRKSVIEAYSMSVQGFFKKPSSIDDLERTLKLIVEYWHECIAPNDIDS